jgi:hypothetical protein
LQSRAIVAILLIKTANDIFLLHFNLRFFEPLIQKPKTSKLSGKLFL